MYFRPFSLLPLLASYSAAQSVGSGSFNNDETINTALDIAPLYPEHNFSMLVDHFHNDSVYEPHSDGKFNMRYWFDPQFYEPGGPVILLQSGEVTAEGEFDIMQKGIGFQLARATNGLCVILEHRYYGTSFPTPRADLSVENLRFLTVDQALADTAYFARNIKFPGLEQYNLSAPDTAWIVYGGSYAGGLSAFLRKLYPETFWGAISSSGVTLAQWNFWQYYEAVRIHGPQECVKNTQQLVDAMDNILINNKNYTQELKRVFGAEALTQDEDFVTYLAGNGIEEFQGLHWDPTLTYLTFGRYCGNLSSSTIEFPETEELRSTVETLLDAGGYGEDKERLATYMLNWIGLVTEFPPVNWQGFMRNLTRYQDVSYTGRVWLWQTCTQLGWFRSSTGLPDGQLPLISKLISLEYMTAPCRAAFGRTEPADTNSVNKYGGLDISYDRLAIIGGERDPWLPVTPHATSQPGRSNTIDEPFILIENGVHIWDQNGVFDNETTSTFPPAEIKDVQAQERNFVQAWMKEWHERGAGEP